MIKSPVWMVWVLTVIIADRRSQPKNNPPRKSMNQLVDSRSLIKRMNRREMRLWKDLKSLTKQLTICRSTIQKMSFLSSISFTRCSTKIATWTCFPRTKNSPWKLLTILMLSIVCLKRSYRKGKFLKTVTGKLWDSLASHFLPNFWD